MAAPILNAVTIYPSKITRHKTKIGKVQVTANGTRTFIQRTNGVGTPLFQSRWELAFDGITEARRAAMLSLANASTVVTWVDQNAVAYNAHTEEDAYSESVSLILPDGTYRYDVTLTLFEG